MKLFWQKIQQFFHNLFVRSEWTFNSVLYVIGIIILGILLLPFIIVALIFGLIIYLLMLPKIIRTKKMIKQQIQAMDPQAQEKTWAKDAKEATVIDEEIDSKDSTPPILAD